MPCQNQVSHNTPRAWARGHYPRFPRALNHSFCTCLRGAGPRRIWRRGRSAPPQRDRLPMLATDLSLSTACAKMRLAQTQGPQPMAKMQSLGSCTSTKKCMFKLPKSVGCDPLPQCINPVKTQKIGAGTLLRARRSLKLSQYVVNF